MCDLAAVGSTLSVVVPSTTAAGAAGGLYTDDQIVPDATSILSGGSPTSGTLLNQQQYSSYNMIHGAALAGQVSIYGYYTIGG